jgi:hypothetical protein
MYPCTGQTCLLSFCNQWQLAPCCALSNETGNHCLQRCCGSKACHLEVEQPCRYAFRHGCRLKAGCHRHLVMSTLSLHPVPCCCWLDLSLQGVPAPSGPVSQQVLRMLGLAAAFACWYLQVHENGTKTIDN